MLSGEVIKRLRLKKGMAARDVYQNVVSKASYYKFENGDADTSSENFLEFLHRLGIHLFEFAGIYVVELLDISKRKIVLAGSEQALETKDIQLFEEMAEIASALYESGGDIVDRHNYLQLTIYRDYFKNGEVREAQAELDEIFGYLLSRDTLYRYDVAVFCNLLPFLTWDQVAPYVRTLLKRAEISPLPVSAELESVTKASIYYNLIKIPIREGNASVFLDLVDDLLRVPVSFQDTLPYFGCILLKECQEYLKKRDRRSLDNIDQMLVDLWSMRLQEIYQELSQTYLAFKKQFVA